MRSRPPDNLLRAVLASFGSAPFLARDAAERGRLDPQSGPEAAEREALFAEAIADFARRHPGSLERIPRGDRPPLWRALRPLFDGAPPSSEDP